jgi:hypothetical protein
MILTLTFSFSVLAGHIETPGAPAPPTGSTTSITTSIVLAILGLPPLC